MTLPLNLLGRRFGRLKVTARAENSKSGKARWACRCDCGATSVCVSPDLITGKTRSCGCLRREVTSRLSLVHGMKDAPEYHAWKNMRRRCYTPPNASTAEAYRDRGIRICQRWKLSFLAFFKDMGKRPSARHSIDRVNNAKGYMPGNCRWATRKVQANNRRKRRWRIRPELHRAHP